MTQLSDEVVERVARAISTKCYAVTDGKDDCCDWPEMSERAKAVYREASRAAIAAYEAKGDVVLDAG